jgi:signal transduction histidine kinase
VVLGVKDSGIGIAKESIEKLFQRFTRLDNAQKTRPDGTGLGLYVCKQIVTAHSGRIWVESEVGQGSTFYINIPRVESTKAMQQQTQEMSKRSELESPSIT